MRLAPIENPKGLKLRLAYWATRREFGKAITPLKVVAARMPGMLRLTRDLAEFNLKGIRLDPELHLLIEALTAQINGCTFCLDIGRAIATREQLKMEKFDAIADYRTNPLFSDRERAALAYVEEATRSKHVCEATFDDLRKHFDEREIVEITWVNALENYYNLINLPLEIGSDGLCALAETRKERGHRKSA